MQWHAVAYWTGLPIVLTAALLANIAVRKMAQVVNTQRSGLEKVKWELKNDRANRAVIRRYRETNPDGPLFRNFLIACGLFAVGAVVMFSQDFP